MPPGPVVVCDPGVDDFVALAVLAGSGQPPGAIIGTAGNVDVELAFRNAGAIASLLGLDCPVAQGEARSLHGPYPDTGDPFHGSDGLGGIGAQLAAAPATVPRPAALPLAQGCLIAIGALTVVAAALQAGQPVDEIVWMGGAVACGGNMTAAAEFNAWLDPEACDRASLFALHASGAPAYPHDAEAVVAWLHPELFEWEERWVRCELAGSWTRGMTVVDRRRQTAGGSVRIPVEVDVVAVKERIVEALRTLG